MVKGYKKIRWAWVVAIVWALVIVAISVNYRANVSSMQMLERMAKNVDELQSILVYDAPFRTNQLDKISVIIQRIYIMRIKLETELSNGFVNPDINQALYTIDRYIEHIRSYVRSETDVVTLVNRLRDTREKYVSQEQLQTVYFQLSSYVLEALYSDSNGSPDVYRALDKVFLLSQSLPAEQGKELQQVLGQISTVLGSYAQSNYLVEKLLNNSIQDQIFVLEEEYHHYLSMYIIIIVAFSGFCIFALSFSRGRKPTPKAVETTTDIPQALATTGPEISQPSPVVRTAAEVAQPPENTRSAAAVESVELNTEEVSNNSAIDFEKLTDSLGGDRDSVALLLNVFIEDHKEDVQLLKTFIGSDHDKALRKAHSLKGVAANIGANDLRETAYQIEKSLKDNEPVTSQMLQELSVRLDRAVGAATGYIKENE